MDQKHPLMFVKWIDPHSIDPWTPISEIETAHHLVNTVGYLVREDDTMLALAGSVIPGHGEAGSIMVIPLHAIVEQFELEV